MVRFVTKDSKAEVLLSYEQLVQEFLSRPASKKGSGFLIDMMLFLESFRNKKGLEFVRLKHNDWIQLLKATSRISPV